MWKKDWQYIKENIRLLEWVKRTSIHLTEIPGEKKWDKNSIRGDTGWEFPSEIKHQPTCLRNPLNIKQNKPKKSTPRATARNLFLKKA